MSKMHDFGKLWCDLGIQAFRSFWTIFEPFQTPNPNFGGPVLGQFFCFKIQAYLERCHVMPGLYATFSNPRDTLSGSKRPKIQFYSRSGPHFLVPHFRLFFLFKIQACWVSRALPCDAWSLRNPFKFICPRKLTSKENEIKILCVLKSIFPDKQH